MRKEHSQLPEIRVKVIPHGKQRYPTVGDYFERRGRWEFRISRIGDARYEFLVLIHELVEWFLCWLRGIPEEEITKFDVFFEWEIQQGKHPEDAEPGDDPRCPYRREHKFATRIEKMVAKALGVDWEEYNQRLDALFEEELDDEKRGVL